MGHILSRPITSKFIQRRGETWIRVGASEMQGYRTDMEDEHIIQTNLFAGKKEEKDNSHKQIGLFAVFDGHSGSTASQYMKKELQTRITNMTNPLNHKELQETIVKMDEDFLTHYSETSHHGTTACIALISPSAPVTTANRDKIRYKIIIANVGDSRALAITKDGLLVSSTEDHKPTDSEEQKRIQSAGGHVTFGRVDGELAMSRSIGDSNYKSSSELSHEKQKVIAVPDIQEFELGWGDRLVLCCDGLVEKLSNDQISAFVHASLQKIPNDPAVIMNMLCELSLMKGSKDNMSAMLILFQDGIDYGKSSNSNNNKNSTTIDPEYPADDYVPGPFTDSDDNPKYVEAFMIDGKRHGYEHPQLMSLVKYHENKGTREKEVNMMRDLWNDAMKFSSSISVLQEKANREIEQNPMHIAKSFMDGTNPALASINNNNNNNNASSSTGTAGDGKGDAMETK